MAAGKKVKKLPMSLGEALDALEKDEVIKSAMPDEMYRVFMHYKRDEWEKFMATVTALGSAAVLGLSAVIARGSER